MPDFENDDNELENQQDSHVDAIAAFILIVVLVSATLIWVSNQ